jgi:L-alanine-DL-glutamate epimerase-like enolase superfamily enzyme
VPGIDAIEVSAHRMPTDDPFESDGTLRWSSTTMVLVRVRAGGATGLGFSYTHSAAVELIRTELADCVRGADPMAVRRTWGVMRHAVRNLGRPGIVANAISAVDVALWDLKARLLDLPLADLLGRVRDGVRVYGSGGFTSETYDQLQRQLGGWVEAGIGAVKMKVGRDPSDDLVRVRLARQAIGGAELMIDANGAFSPRRAVAFAERVAPHGVSWFEEPVVAEDIDGLRFVRDHAPAAIEVTTGEYGYLPTDYVRWLGAVDVLQVDVTRCIGVTGLLQICALCDAHGVSQSTHTAPSLHLPLGCALPGIRHLEWFSDHVRIESAWFEGFPALEAGRAVLDPRRPGLGLTPREAELHRHAL